MSEEKQTSEELEKLISSLQSLKQFLDAPEHTSEEVLNALLASQSLSKLVPEVRSATYAIAGEHIQKSEKIGAYTVSKVTYKPVPTLTEGELARLRVEAPEVFEEVVQPGKKLEEEEKEGYQKENITLMDRAREVNDALHADEMFYHPALKEKYTVGTGAEKLANLLRQAGPEWEEVIQNWQVKPFIFRLVKKSN